MHIKIYFGDKPLFLCDAIEEKIQPYVRHDDAVFIDELNGHTIKTMLHEMQQPAVHAGVFLHPDFNELKNAFYKKFTLLQTGGGLITNEKNEILLIFRRGKWDMPKGKKEEGESLEACALREVTEETGLHQVQLVKPLTITWHTYHEGTKFMLKESHWYYMQANGKETLVPQAEEDIQLIKWVTPHAIGEYLPGAFPSIVDVLEAFGAPV